MSLKRHLKELNLAVGQIPGMAWTGADQAQWPPEGSLKQEGLMGSPGTHPRLNRLPPDLLSSSKMESCLIPLRSRFCNHHLPLTHCGTGNQTANDFRLALVHMDGPCSGLFGRVASLQTTREGG